jgi:hypothetical protein
MAGTVTTAPIAGGPSVVLASGQDFPLGIAADSSGVYWMNGLPNDTISKVALKGGTPQAIASNQCNPSAIVLDAARIFWTDDCVYGGGVMKLAK